MTFASINNFKKTLFDPKITMGNEEIASTPSYKYVDVTFDPGL